MFKSHVYRKLLLESEEPLKLNITEKYWEVGETDERILTFPSLKSWIHNTEEFLANAKLVCLSRGKSYLVNLIKFPKFSLV